MAKKVQAWMSSNGIDEIGTRPVSVEAMPSPYGIHARAVTIVQHHDNHYGTHERVFTESEVRAILMEVRSKLETGWVHPDEITGIANTGGIVLDPA